MNSRERILSILSKNGADGAGFWTGNPHDDAAEIYLEKLGLGSREELYTFLNDDCRWLPATDSYRHPEGRSVFEFTPFHSEEGVFANCESIAEVDAYEWPDPEYLDFTTLVEKIRLHQDKAVFTGFWTSFFHLAAQSFGMENYFVKMYTHPEVVEAVIGRILDFYLEANRRCFEAVGDLADTFFFGNDFGTQLSTLISPQLFEKFVLPGMKANIALAKKYGKKVILHSCGAIREVIPMLIDAGIDGLHPLQALAAGMDAETLSREFAGKIAFIGGVDTQHLLVHGTPQDIKDEVKRLKDLFGGNFIISPSHEAILPNVPLENIIAMSQAARE